MNKIAITTITVLSMLVFFVAACEEGSVSTGGSPVAEVVDGQSDAALQSAYRVALEDAVPMWDDDILAIPKSTSKTSFLEVGPLAHVKAVTSSSLEEAGFTGNGDFVYADTDNNVAVKYNEAKGFWKFVTPPPADKGLAADQKLTDSKAKEFTEALFEEFNLPVLERGGFIATGVGEADMGPDGEFIAPRTTARHVRLFREINGMEVWDSHVMATYTLSGKLFRLEIRWPVFDLGEGKSLKDRDTVMEDLSKEMLNVFGVPAKNRAIRSALVYWFNEEKSIFEPTLIVSVHDGEETNPTSIRYSLTEGLWKPDEDLGKDI